MTALEWTRAKEPDPYGVVRVTYRAALPDGEEVVIRTDGIPSWPFTLTWPNNQGEFYANRLYTAKAEAQAYADHLAEVAGATKLADLVVPSLVTVTLRSAFDDRLYDAVVLEQTDLLVGYDISTYTGRLREWAPKTAIHAINGEKVRVVK